MFLLVPSPNANKYEELKKIVAVSLMIFISYKISTIYVVSSTGAISLYVYVTITVSYVLRTISLMLYSLFVYFIKLNAPKKIVIHKRIKNEIGVLSLLYTILIIIYLHVCT